MKVLDLHEKLFIAYEITTFQYKFIQKDLLNKFWEKCSNQLAEGEFDEYWIVGRLGLCKRKIFYTNSQPYIQNSSSSPTARINVSIWIQSNLCSMSYKYVTFTHKANLCSNNRIDGILPVIINKHRKYMKLVVILLFWLKIIELNFVKWLFGVFIAVNVSGKINSIIILLIR